MEAKRGMLEPEPLPPITEDQKLADALIGAIRVRSVDATRAERLGVASSFRWQAKEALSKAGVPFKTTGGGNSFEVKHGVLRAFRIDKAYHQSEEVVEYVWVPNPDLDTSVSCSVSGTFIGREVGWP